MISQLNKDVALIRKYNVAVPRYTSYPTVPHWQEAAPGQEEWIDLLIGNYKESPGLSLYIHLPFCESLCTYCGCNKRITKNHAVETPYIKAVLAEWDIYLSKFEEPPIVKEIHLGGGTPTFFSSENLKFLMNGILGKVVVSDDHSFSFEAHPNTTDIDHLQTLYNVGFRRVSLGIQDVSPEILKAINRVQTEEEISTITEAARRIGYTSINYDIIYGLPFQKPLNVYKTIEFIKTQRPDRIAFYSYAHVPWKSASQRAYSIEDVPAGDAKIELYERGKSMLAAEGYEAIGMDHFCLPDEELYLSYRNGTMHRNFMGYTPKYTKCSIALGASSISDCWDMYVQNEKKIEDYQRVIAEGRFPITKGHRLSESQLEMRKHILNLFCRDQTVWSTDHSMSTQIESSRYDLEALAMDGLISCDEGCITIRDKGKYFIRNICAAIDPIFQDASSKQQVFSKAI